MPFRVHVKKMGMDVMEAMGQRPTTTTGGWNRR